MELNNICGWAGGKKNAHVAVTTPTPPIAHNAPTRTAAGFILEDVWLCTAPAIDATASPNATSDDSFSQRCGSACYRHGEKEVRRLGGPGWVPAEPSSVYAGDA